MPIFSDVEYDALVYVARAREKRNAVRWEAKALKAYCGEKYGQMNIFSLADDENLGKQIRQAYRMRRQRFLHRAKSYSIDGTKKVLLKNGKSVLRKDEYNAMLQRYHEHGIHEGSKKLRAVFTAKFADVDYQTIDDYCHSCMHCNTRKPSHTKAIHNNPIRVYNTFQRVGIDFTEFTDPRNSVDKYNLLVIVDYFSRYGWVRCLPQKCVVNGDYTSRATGEMVAATLLELFFSISQVPRELQSDNGSQFTSGCLKTLMQKMEVRMIHAAPYTPTTGGRFERFGGTIKQRISAVLMGNYDIDVEFAVAYACYKYNQSPHSALCFRNKDLCPVDVWQPQLRTRLSDNRDIPLDELEGGVEVETVHTDPPSFNEQDFEEHTQAINERMIDATQAVMMAEHKIKAARSSNNQQKSIHIGDTGTVQVPKSAQTKAGMKRVPVMVSSVSADKTSVSVHPIDPSTQQVQKDTLISRRVPVHHFKHVRFRNQSGSAQQQSADTGASPQTHCSLLAAWVFANVKSDMSILDHYSDDKQSALGNKVYNDILRQISGMPEKHHEEAHLAITVCLIDNIQKKIPASSIPDVIPTELAACLSWFANVDVKYTSRWLVGCFIDRSTYSAMADLMREYKRPKQTRSKKSIDSGHKTSVRKRKAPANSTGTGLITMKTFASMKPNTQLPARVAHNKHGYSDNYNNCYAASVFSLIQYTKVYISILKKTSSEIPDEIPGCLALGLKRLVCCAEEFHKSNAKERKGAKEEYFTQLVKVYQHLKWDESDEEGGIGMMCDPLDLYMKIVSQLLEYISVYNIAAHRKLQRFFVLQLDTMETQDTEDSRLVGGERVILLRTRIAPDMHANRLIDMMVEALTQDFNDSDDQICHRYQVVVDKNIMVPIQIMNRGETQEAVEIPMSIKYPHLCGRRHGPMDVTKNEYRLFSCILYHQLHYVTVCRQDDNRWLLHDGDHEVQIISDYQAVQMMKTRAYFLMYINSAKYDKLISIDVPTFFTDSDDQDNEELDMETFMAGVKKSKVSTPYSFVRKTGKTTASDVSHTGKTSTSTTKQRNQHKKEESTMIKMQIGGHSSDTTFGQTLPLDLTIGSRTTASDNSRMGEASALTTEQMKEESTMIKMQIGGHSSDTTFGQTLPLDTTIGSRTTASDNSRMGEASALTTEQMKEESTMIKMQIGGDSSDITFGQTLPVEYEITIGGEDETTASDNSRMGEASALTTEQMKEESTMIKMQIGGDSSDTTVGHTLPVDTTQRDSTAFKMHIGDGWYPKGSTLPVVRKGTEHDHTYSDKHRSQDVIIISDSPDKSSKSAKRKGNSRSKLSLKKRKTPKIDNTSALSDMGYHFNEAGVLIHTKLDRHFKFIDQDHYIDVGDAVTEYLYDILQRKHNLLRFYLPINANEDQSRSFVFTTRSVIDLIHGQTRQETNKKLVVLIHGSGDVRAGQWSRSLMINKGLNMGSMIPYICHAKESGYEVILMNTNLNYDKGLLIPENSHPNAHANYVWRNILTHWPGDIVVIAHSAGGIVTVSMARDNYPDFMKKVQAIALSDSAHTFIDCSDDIKKWLIQNSRNWVTSAKPLDAIVNNASTHDCTRVSAGTLVHIETPAYSMDSMFKFIDVHTKEEARYTQDLSPDTDVHKDHDRPEEDDEEKPLEDDEEKPLEDDQEKPLEDDEEKPLEDDQEKPIEDNRKKPAEDIMEIESDSSDMMTDNEEWLNNPNLPLEKRTEFRRNQIEKLKNWTYDDEEQRRKSKAKRKKSVANVPDFPSSQESYAPYGHARKWVDEIFKDVVGHLALKEYLVEVFATQLDYKYLHKGEQRPPMHLVLQGPPGTGKTTIATLIKDVLFKLELIQRDFISQISASALTAFYEGQTRQKTRSAVLDALGGVFFLDEAYSLMNRSKQGYGKEALDELMCCMNEPGNPNVILAGYASDMENLIGANQGFRRRVKILRLEPYSDCELIEMLQVKLKCEEASLEVSDALLAEKISSIPTSIKNDNNGGVVARLIQGMKMARVRSIVYKKGNIPQSVTFTQDHLVHAISAVIKDLQKPTF